MLCYMPIMSLPFLETIGLTKKEAELYELLLRLGEVPAQDIIRESRLKRATVYKSLYALEKKGLVTKKDIEKKIHFRPEPPTNLISLAETQYQLLDRAKHDLQSNLPNLRSQYVLTVEKPIIRIFEGVEGLKQAHLEVLGEKKEILAYVRLDKKLDAPLADFWPQYYRIRRKNNIFVRSICPDNPEGRAYKKKDKKELRETRLIPFKLYPFEIEKNIVGNKVLFFSRQEGKLIATLIENKAIADTERAIFELAWDKARIYSKSKN